MNVQVALATLIEVASTQPNGVAIRGGAIEGLGHIGGAEAREALAKILAQRANGEEIRKAAARALGMACHR